MNELNVTFTLNPAWLAVGAGLLAVLVLGFLYSRWPRWKERRKRRAFERRERRKWEGHRLK